MPLWGNKDNAANSDIAATMQVNRATTAADQTALYGNVTAGAFVTNVAIGQFAVDTNEVRANGKIPHSGWVLRKEGTGLRAGRVTYETLVASGSIPTTDASDDTNMPDYRITVSTQPSSNTATTAKNLTFTIVATTVPTGATLAYKWQRNTLAGTGGWVDVANASGQYFNNTSPTFTANNKTANGNVFRTMITTTGGNTVYSANATILYVTP